jgi:hypothetical protein
VKNALIAVIAAAFLAIPFCVLAEESITSARPDVIAPPESQVRPADSSAGKWTGGWDTGGRTWVGKMEMEVDVNGDQVTGQVRSTGSPTCSLEWVKLTGVKKGEKVFAQYNLGGRCGKVDIICSVDREGRVMTGTWSSEYPGSGTFRLTR